MVLQKQFNYGFFGCQLPSFPRGSRSARRRRLFKKEVEVSQMCAFDLLATVAGELLSEKESSPASGCVLLAGAYTKKDTAKQEKQDGKAFSKPEPCDEGSCDESESVIMYGPHKGNQDHSLVQHFNAKEDSTSGFASIFTKHEKPDDVYCFEESAIGEEHKECKNSPDVSHETCLMENDSPETTESQDGKEVGEIERQLEVDKRTKSMSNVTSCILYNMHGDDSIKLDTKPLAFVSSDSSAGVPYNGAENLYSQFQRCRDGIKIYSKDDDENSSGSGCTQRSTSSLKSFMSPCLGDRKTQKLIASKYWKAAPVMLNDEELSNTEFGMKPLYRSRKICYTRQRSQRYSFKKRKIVERSVTKTSDGGFNFNVASKPYENETNGERNDLVSRESSPLISSTESKDAHVKLRIRSFKVPELFIEIPETTTVGLLKRTVMDAVNAVLGGGLRVGVIVQGKKVRDDSRTLLQTGISSIGKLDSLGFTLEPAASGPESSADDPFPADDTFPLHLDSTQPVNRNPLAPLLDPSEVSPDHLVANMKNSIEDTHDSTSFATDSPQDKTMLDSELLVAVPANEALAMVPMHTKSKRSDVRRIRRPFSVSEVESLVQAVEKLGTGRWRDVKLCAFENAKHRTYVDLKDKWKTLVHTARISPQQRRGEPVPQELLDRVLAAHAYWAQHHQAKHHHHHHHKHLQLQLQQPEPNATVRF